MPGKQRIVLLVLVLFGLPAVLTLTLLFTNARGVVHDGPQPGGVVKGTVQDEEGRALAGIEVSAVALSTEQGPIDAGKTHTGADGAFTLTLPPVRGRYVLTLADEGRETTRVEYGWLDASGNTIEHDPLNVMLRPGYGLDVAITRADGRPAGPGKFELEGDPAGGFLAGVGAPRVKRSGTFESGAFRIDGLPAAQMRVLIRMDSGERIDVTIELARRDNHFTVEL